MELVLFGRVTRRRMDSKSQKTNTHTHTRSRMKMYATQHSMDVVRVCVWRLVNGSIGIRCFECGWKCCFSPANRSSKANLYSLHFRFIQRKCCCQPISARQTDEMCSIWNELAAPTDWLLPFSMHASIIWESLFIPPSSPTFAAPSVSSTDWYESVWLSIVSRFWEMARSVCAVCMCGSNVTHQKPLIYFNSTICRCVSAAILPDSTLFFVSPSQYSLSRCRKYMFIRVAVVVFFHRHHHHLLVLCLSYRSLCFLILARVSID